MTGLVVPWNIIGYVQVGVEIQDPIERMID